MKKLISHSLIILTVVFSIGCNETPDPNENQSKSDKNTAATVGHLIEMNLEQYNIPAIVSIPDSSYGITSVEESPTGGVVVKVGNMFQIEVAEEGDLDLRKEDLKTGYESLVYTAEIIDEGDNFILFKQNTVNGDMAPKYRFYYVFEADGFTYSIQDWDEGGPYPEKAVQKMLHAAKLVKELSSGA